MPFRLIGTVNRIPSHPLSALDASCAIPATVISVARWPGSDPPRVRFRVECQPRLCLAVQYGLAANACIGSVASIEAVGAIAAIQRVVSRRARNGVVSRFPEQRVRIRIAGDRVIVLGPDDLPDPGQGLRTLTRGGPAVRSTTTALGE
jgi:hypothetical protein